MALGSKQDENSGKETKERPWACVLDKNGVVPEDNRRRCNTFVQSCEEGQENHLQHGIYHHENYGIFIVPTSEFIHVRTIATHLARPTNIKLTSLHGGQARRKEKPMQAQASKDKIATSQREKQQLSHVSQKNFQREFRISSGSKEPPVESESRVSSFGGKMSD
ncbi:hypothetical protein NA56DRAFT_702381 [Hyaloscypha hepaticicola]|uniref:Uncharacterized protein n=1 Tax=Hyaloscypha hepaticicola TaxID=2082293 RepID=A0A2J6Q8N3_9HELO|nr:hypothetical protein NA56DRAFT_702381 [Hyaloscypha hepaticicola]